LPVRRIRAAIIDVHFIRASLAVQQQGACPFQLTTGAKDCLRSGDVAGPDAAACRNGRKSGASRMRAGAGRANARAGASMSALHGPASQPRYDCALRPAVRSQRALVAGPRRTVSHLSERHVRVHTAAALQSSAARNINARALVKRVTTGPLSMPRTPPVRHMQMLMSEPVMHDALAIVFAFIGLRFEERQRDQHEQAYCEPDQTRDRFGVHGSLLKHATTTS
jgi:hypothetical protein